MLKRFDNVYGRLFRGSRPENIDDLKLLWSRGVRSIISLEEGYARARAKILGGYLDERKDWLAMGGEFYDLPLSNILPPPAARLWLAHHIISSNSGVYVHCFAGVDRTGMVIAYYLARIGLVSPVQAWELAIAYGMHRRYRWWKSSFLKACEEFAPRES